MVASFMNPHDICQWIRDHKGSREYPDPDRFPAAPGNMAIDTGEPEMIQYHRRAGYDLMSQAVGIASEWKRDDVRHYLHDYYRMVEDVDRQIGKVLAALRQSGLDRNTVIAFASDHGEGMGAHRWAQKAAFWEEAVRVPMLLAGPGIAPGVERKRLASLADLLPTLCDFGGIDAPKDLEGASLRRPAARTHVSSELRYGSAEREGRMIRTARYKYVAFSGGARREQLFDLEHDPGEVFNLVNRPEAGGALEEHRRLLGRWVSQTGDDFRYM
jgi:arylsulfatase A-like enzyme